MKLEQYISIESKKQFFKEGGTRYSQIVDPDEFDDWYAGIVNLKGKIYRGVSEASYKNFTSAQRLYITHDLFLYQIDDVIEEQINNLRTANNSLLEGYCKALGLPCTDLFIMSMAQHHKDSISPLLDFSTDINTALYFMQKGAKFPNNGTGDREDGRDIENYVSIYYTRSDDYISLPILMEATYKLVKEFGLRALNTRDEITKDCSFSKLKKIKEPLFIPLKGEIESSYLISCNLNMVAQDGCFVYHNTDTPLEKNLSCVDIHKSLLPYIRKKYLIPNGKTDEKMFPVIDDISAESFFNALASLRPKQ